MKTAIVALACLALIGCASTVSEAPYRGIDASLRQPCPVMPPLRGGPDGGTGADLTRWAVPAIKLYESCRAGKLGLIEATAPLK